MRIAAMAAGAVGGYFGARMAAAGHDVTFIARGAHRDAIRADGLIVESTLGNLHLKDAKVTDDPGEVGPVDIVLFAVKLWDTEKAAAQARPLIGPNTRLITFQNGVDSVERIAPILGADHIAGGSAYIATVIGRPGVIAHTSPFAKLRCGRIDGRQDSALETFSNAATKAGIDIETSKEMNRVRWEKFTFLVAMSGITASTREGMGVAMSDPDIKAMFRAMMAEVVAVARASGVNLTDAFLEEQFKFAEGVPPGMKASMAHDLERGNRLELDWLSGKVVELGRKFAVPVPANEAVYAILKPHRFGRTH
jgi:2-dehydropantoate 2-reductase